MKTSKIITLTITLTTDTGTNPKLSATLKHKCKDKESALGIINEYLKRNKRKGDA